MNENEFLATEVMGWSKGKTEYQWMKGPDYMLDGIKFDPRKNIAQAMMLLDQFYDVHIMKEVDAGIKWVWGVELTGITDFHFGSTLPDAIVNAVLKAKGFKGEQDD